MFPGILALLAVATAPEAPRAPEAPAASARMMSGSQFQLHWYGVGELRATAQMCVTSTTGRYQLEVMPVSVNPGKQGDLPFSMVISAKGGNSISQDIRNNEFVLFEGRSVPDDCGGNGNVTVELQYHNRSLQGALAGRYFERIQINVRPA